MFVWLGGPLSYGDYRNLHHDAILTGIDNDIIFTGNVASHLPYFAQFDIFVLPSREDPFPLVALDAASIGIPIVCFDQAGGAPELVEEDAGIVVPYLDIEQMAEAIKQLVEDNALRKQLGKRAHQKVEERYDATVGGERIVEIIKTYL
jgi:glycosyltransferase involved in cell wall biosynthesis